jgi:hypothetical protein
MAPHSTRSAARVLALAFVLAPLAAQGQDQLPAAAPPPVNRGSAQPTAAAPSIVSLDRIRRQLRETPPTRDPSGVSSLLKLEYYVQVVGSPPPIDFFKDFNIGRGSAVQYGGMTHDEFLRVTAPFWRRRW